MRKTQKHQKELNKLRKQLGSMVKRGKYQKALNVVRRKRTADPEYWYLWFLEGWIFHNNNKVKEAVGAYKKADELEPDQRYTKVALGEIYLAQSDFDLAYQYLIKCVGGKFDNSKVYSNLGQTQIQRKEFDEAEKSLRRSIELNNRNPDAWSALISVYRETSREHLIEELLEEYIEVAPEAVSSHMFLATYLYEKCGDCEGALTHYEDAIRLYSTDDHPGWYKTFFSTLGYPDKIIDSYIDALLTCGYYDLAQTVGRDFYEKANYYGLLYIIKMDVGEISKAKEYLQKAISLNPDDLYIRYLFAGDLYFDEKIDEAFTVIRKVINDAEKKGLSDPWFFGLLAVLMNERGKTNNVDELSEKFFDAQYEHFIRSMLRIHETNKNWNEMISICKKEIVKNPESPIYLHNLAKAYRNIGQYELSIEHYKKLIQIQPKNGIALFEVSMAYKGAGHIGKAVNSFNQALDSDKVPKPNKEVIQQELSESM